MPDEIVMSIIKGKDTAMTNTRSPYAYAWSPFEESSSEDSHHRLMCQLAASESYVKSTYPRKFCRRLTQHLAKKNSSLGD